MVINMWDQIISFHVNLMAILLQNLRVSNWMREIQENLKYFCNYNLRPTNIISFLMSNTCVQKKLCTITTK